MNEILWFLCTVKISNSYSWLVIRYEVLHMCKKQENAQSLRAKAMVFFLISSTFLLYLIIFSLIFSLFFTVFNFNKIASSWHRGSDCIRGKASCDVVVDPSPPFFYSPSYPNTHTDTHITYGKKVLVQNVHSFSVTSKQLLWAESSELESEFKVLSICVPNIFFRRKLSEPIRRFFKKD